MKEKNKNKERNETARNFGWRSARMDLALKNALRDNKLSNQTIATYSTAINDFVGFMKNDENIKDLRKIEIESVQRYAEYLKEKVVIGDLAVSSAQNYLSAINSSLSCARGDHDLRFTAVKDADFFKREFIAKVDKSISKDAHANLISKCDVRVAAVLELQREFGLRNKESCLINANKALDQAREKGVVTIERGTKGGRVREIQITSDRQIVALIVASEIQQKDRSLVPADQKFSQFQDHIYYQVGHGVHGERHNYANDRYEQIAGVQSPVRVGVEHKDHIAYIAKELNISIDDAKNKDVDARKQISEELGHSRVSITNSYIG